MEAVVGVALGVCAAPLARQVARPTAAPPRVSRQVLGVALGMCAGLICGRVLGWARAPSSPGGRVDAIVVPGGGQAAVWGDPPPAHVAARLELAAALYAAAPAPKPKIALLSGGTPHKPNPRDAAGFDAREATTNARWLLANAGVPARDLVEEPFSLDTIGNAFFLRVWHADPARWRRLVVVNNAFHMPRTRAIFDHVFGLPALDGSRAGYALSYAEAPNAMDAAVEAARSAREARSLAAYAATARRVRTLGDLHAFLFFDHAAYAASRLLKPPEPLDAAALRSY